MRFMNEFDIERALQRYDAGVTPHRKRLAHVVARLSYWADANSDGWAYWLRPAQAATKAMELIDPITNADVERMIKMDATEQEYAGAVRPIKAFLTRQGVPHSEVGL